MRLLVDTHVWLWLQTTPDRVDAVTLQVLANEANDLYLSAASGWEIAVKYRLGKLALPQLPEVYVPDRMRTSGTTPLAVEHAHALRVANLPDHHRDPFDRLLIAQAQMLDMPIVTADPQFSMYDVELMGA
ncbi:MAG TPA: type II toxin-antitoxin system VapC family toxin [Acidimicrobiales bacterium]|nr:type II toxin-antitoxin system VapC family toxin [Acidimicrobiales bacterium]